MNRKIIYSITHSFNSRAFQCGALEFGVNFPSNSINPWFVFPGLLRGIGSPDLHLEICIIRDN